MNTTVTRNTEFSEIYNALATTGAGDKELRGRIKDGLKALYLHTSKSWFGWLPGRKAARERKRAAAAQEVRAALVNQYGVKIADSVLKNVTVQSDRDLSKSISVSDLRNIKLEIEKQAQPDPKAVSRQQAVAETTQRLSQVIGKWNSDNGAARGGNNQLDQVGSSYQSLSGDKQRFVAGRLKILTRDEAKATGRPVNDERLAKLASKLIKQAQSDNFGELKQAWDHAKDRAQNLMGSLRGGRRRDIGNIVQNANSFAVAVKSVIPQEQKAAGKSDGVMDAIGGDDTITFAEQGIDTQSSGHSIAECHTAYRKSMGTKGAARAVLFAAVLAELKIPQKGDNRDYLTVLNDIVTGTQSALRGYAEKAGIDSHGKEFAAIAGALEEALKEMASSQGVSDERSTIRAIVKVEDEMKKDGPLDPKFKSVIALAMKKAGISDKAMVEEAYRAIMEKTGLDQLPAEAKGDNTNSKPLRNETMSSDISIVSDDDDELVEVAESQMKPRTNNQADENKL